MVKFAIIKGKNIDDDSLRIDPSFYIQETKYSSLKNNYVLLSNYITTPSSNFNPKKEYGRDFFFYIDISSVDNISGNVYQKKMRGNDAPSRARRQVQTNDVLISSVRPERRSVTIITEKENGYICSNGFIICRPNLDIIKPGYLFVLLKSDEVTKQLVKRTTATMYPTINQSDILNLKVIVKNVRSQNEISKRIINAIKSISKNQKRIIDNIEAMS